MSLHRFLEFVTYLLLGYAVLKSNKSDKVNSWCQTCVFLYYLSITGTHLLFFDRNFRRGECIYRMARAANHNLLFRKLVLNLDQPTSDKRSRHAQGHMSVLSCWMWTNFAKDRVSQETGHFTQLRLLRTFPLVLCLPSSTSHWLWVRLQLWCPFCF